MTISIRRAALALVLAGAGLGALTACAPLIGPVLVGGTVMGGMVASDRRTSGAQLEDEGIEVHTRRHLRDRIGERAHINVTSYNRQVLLTGEVPSEQDKQLAQQLASGVENVRNVVNELDVMGNSTLTQRSSDAITTGKVKANLVDARDLFANAFKIVTERGTTYVMGRVTAREARRGTEVISATSGVQRVVRILETISEEELARTLPPPPPPAGAQPAQHQP